MKYAYFKSRVKQRKKKESNDLRIILLFVLALVILFCVVMPQKSGEAGKWIKKELFLLFGQATFVLPVLFVWYAVMLFKKEKFKWLKFVASLAAFVNFCAFLSIIGLLNSTNYGGHLGLLLKDFFVNMFGAVGAALVLAAGLIYLTCSLFNISAIEIIRYIFDSITKDIREWQDARKQLVRIKQDKPKTDVSTREILIAREISKKGAEASASVQEAPAAAKIQAQKDVPPTIRKITQPPLPPKQAPEPKKEKEKEKEIKPEVPYVLPSIDLIPEIEQKGHELNNTELMQKAASLEQTLKSFGVLAKVIDISPGPTITRYDLIPESGVRVQQITALSNDIALAMKVQGVRIITSVPEKGAIGIEIPNTRSRLVSIREILASQKFHDEKSKLCIALGKTTDGESYVTDLSSMPHLLIAGSTGSGKSVCIHSIITSFMFKARPDEVKFLLIDPKRLELSTYNGLPHLYDPGVASEKAQVVTDAKDAARSLALLVRVMEKRYEKFAKATVRNIEGYNEYAKKLNLPKEYYIVVIIDELADLMLTIPKEVEDSIQRLAQMARAVGIHLVLATQRPSVDVITGVIKANLSSRIAFQVLSKVDSRVVLDTMGAEDLLGRGDMLFLATGAAKPFRLQGSYVSEKAVEAIVSFIKKQALKPDYENLFPKGGEDSLKKEGSSENIEQALKLIAERKRVSQDLLKALFGSSAKATDVLSLLEINEYIFKPQGTNKWQIRFDKIEEYFMKEKPENQGE